MSAPSAPVSPATSAAIAKPARARWLACAGLIAGTVLVYANSLHGPFVYDDIPSIRENPTIRQFSPLRDVLLPPAAGGVTVAGRPLLNLSFAFNHALSGEAVWSYHALNILLHLSSGLLLFGLMRQVLAARANPGPQEKRVVLVALGIAALWLWHPLQTQAVNYTVQRAESMMGCFYLLTLYAFMRGAAGRSSAWLALSVAACSCGMATKEVAVTAPVLVLLFDAVFVAGGFGAAWRARRGWHLALVSTWLLLGALLASTGGNRGGSIGFNTGVGWLAYVATQFEALTRYVALSLWPQPLVFEYGTFWVSSWRAVAPHALVVLGLLASVLATWRRHPRLSCAGAAFFLILAPTSLSPGTTQMIVEHRMYLPLAAVVALGALACENVIGRRAGFAVIVAAGALAVLTHARNRAYRSEIALWSDTLAKRPLNPRACENLADAFFKAGRLDEAIAQHERAITLKPDDAQYHYNLALTLAQAGRMPEAITRYETALKLSPRDARVHNNLALALAATGALPRAEQHAAEAVVLAPDNAELHFNRGVILQSLGRAAEAAEAYATALRLQPGYVPAQTNLGGVLLGLGRTAEALVQHDAAYAAAPNSVAGRSNLVVTLTKHGARLAQADRRDEAIAAYERALRLDPRAVGARYNLGNAQLQRGELVAALASYEEALRHQPDYVDARFNLAATLLKLGRVNEAVAQYREILRRAPGDAAAHAELANILAQTGRRAEAITHFEEALRLKPDFAIAREQLERLRRAQK